MSQEVIASLIAGVFSLVPVVLATYAARRVQGLSKELEPQRAAAYKKLWRLTHPSPPTDKGPLPDGPRESSEQALTAW